MQSRHFKLVAICALNFAFAMLIPSLAGAMGLLIALYFCFGLGNGATFQLVPHRWKGKTGVMTGIIGAAGGIGGFYLPVETLRSRHFRTPQAFA